MIVKQSVLHLVTLQTNNSKKRYHEYDTKFSPG